RFGVRLNFSHQVCDFVRRHVLGGTPKLIREKPNTFAGAGLCRRVRIGYHNLLSQCGTFKKIMVSPRKLTWVSMIAHTHDYEPQFSTCKPPMECAVLPLPLFPTSDLLFVSNFRNPQGDASSPAEEWSSREFH